MQVGLKTCQHIRFQNTEKRPPLRDIHPDWVNALYVGGQDGDHKFVYCSSDTDPSCLSEVKTTIVLPIVSWANCIICLSEGVGVYITDNRIRGFNILIGNYFAVHTVAPSKKLVAMDNVSLH